MGLVFFIRRVNHSQQLAWYPVSCERLKKPRLDIKGRAGSDSPFPSLSTIINNATHRPIEAAQVDSEQSNNHAFDNDSNTPKQPSQAQSTPGAQRVPSDVPSNVALLYQEFGLPSPLPWIAPMQGASSSPYLLQSFASTSGILDTMAPSVQWGFAAPITPLQVPKSIRCLRAHQPLHSRLPSRLQYLPQLPVPLMQGSGRAPIKNWINNGTHGSCIHICMACYGTRSQLQYHLDECGHYMCSVCHRMSSSRFDLNDHLDKSGHHSWSLDSVLG